MRNKFAVSIFFVTFIFSLPITFSGPSAQAQVTVEADFQTVTRELDKPPLPGLNLWALGSAGALKHDRILSAYAFASAAAFAAVSDSTERPRVRVNYPLERIKYDRGNPNVLGDETIDFGKGLLPILQLPGPKGAPISAELYDDAAGMDDFIETVERLGLNVYITIDSLPRQPRVICEQATDPSGCLASDPEAFSPLYPDASLIRWNISPPRAYTEWSLLMQKMAATHPNIKWWSIGNEPNHSPWLGDRFGDSFFWSGTKEQFFEFYDRTAEGLAREAKPGVEIGGYGDVFELNPWVSDFLASQPPRLDFLSFHRYSRNPMDVVRAYQDVRGWLNKAGYGLDFPVVLEEFGLAGEPGAGDEAGSQYQAAFVAASLIELFRQGIRDAFYFDIAEHASATNDLVRFNLVPKENTCPITEACTDTEFLEVKLQELTPVHQVVQVFDHLFQTVIHATSNQPDIQVLATKSGDGNVALVLSNFATTAKSTGLKINNVPARMYEVSEYRVDDRRITLGSGVVFRKASSDWNLEAGVESLRTLGRIQPHRKFSAQTIDNRLVTTVELPPYTVALIVLEPNQAENQPPVANAGADQSVECQSPKGALVTLDGSGSTDPDGDQLIYTWRENGAVIAGPSSSSTSQVTLSLGSHPIELTVDDGRGGTDTDEVIIKVVDTIAPEIACALKPTTNPANQPANKGKVPAGQNPNQPPNAGNRDGFYQVEYAVKDACDSNPSVTANIWGVTVVNGEKLKYTQALGQATLRLELIAPDNIKHFIYKEDLKLEVTAIDDSGNTKTEICTATVPPPAAPPIIPDNFALGQNHPNPFNPETWIPYSLAKDVKVAIRIYNVSGLLIRTLDLGHKQSGFYTHKNRAAYWDGKNDFGERVSSGIYFYNIQAGEYIATKKMLLLK